MTMTPTAEQVQAALNAAESAWTDYIVLQHREPIPLDAAARCQERFPELNVLALAEEMEEKRKQFNRILQENAQAMQRRADEISRAFALARMGITLPGEATLKRRNGAPVTLRVEALSTVYDDEKGLRGFLRTSSHGGRVHDTERFYSEDGELYLAEPDLL